MEHLLHPAARASAFAQGLLHPIEIVHAALGHLVHHEGGVTFEQGHQGLHAGEQRPLLVVHDEQDPVHAAPVSAAPDRVDGSPELGDHLARIDLHGVHVATDQPLQVRTEPGGRAELDPVGHLVDRDPQPEVAARELEPALDLDQVRADEVEQPVVVGRQERVVLPEHLA